MPLLAGKNIFKIMILNKTIYKCLREELWPLSFENLHQSEDLLKCIRLFLKEPPPVSRKESIEQWPGTVFSQSNPCLQTIYEWQVDHCGLHKLLNIKVDKKSFLDIVILVNHKVHDFASKIPIGKEKVFVQFDKIKHLLTGFARVTLFEA